MSYTRTIKFTTLLLLLIVITFSLGSDATSYTHEKDIIYGRKYGTALTMDILRSSGDVNGAAIIFVVSAGWRSDSRAGFVKGQSGQLYPQIRELLNRGYTVFSVFHGAQPKYSIPEIIEDLNRAIRFVRYNAQRFQIDPGRIGIWGGSSGGHLSLMQGLAGDYGKPFASDPVDKTSSRVQAVVAYFPVTDFLNFGEMGKETSLGHYAAALDFREFDEKSRGFVKITDEVKVRELKRQISPVTYVTEDDPPTLIFHGDEDKLVPLQQSQLIITKLRTTGVPAELIIKPGGGHGWKPSDEELNQFADWFDEYLGNPAKDARN